MGERLSDERLAEPGDDEDEVTEWVRHEAPYRIARWIVALRDELRERRAAEDCHAPN